LKYLYFLFFINYTIYDIFLQSFFDIFSIVPCFGYLRLVDIPEEGKTNTFIYLPINFSKKLCFSRGKINKKVRSENLPHFSDTFK